MFDSSQQRYGLSLRQRTLKRTLDLVVSIPLLAICSPFLICCWLAATISTRQNGLFIQQRVGIHGNEFPLMKIRSMRNLSGYNSTVTTTRDPRITKVGQFVRRTKLDEFPQLINVILGHMSLVGPRPDVAEYSGTLTGDDRIVLSVRPGITGPASIVFRDEETLLASQDDPESYNRNVIWPRKIEINRQYVTSWTLGTDLTLIVKTVANRS